MTTDHTTQLDLAAVRGHAAGTERWIRAAARGLAVARAYLTR